MAGAYSTVLMLMFAPVGEALLLTFMGQIGDTVRVQAANRERVMERLLELSETEVQKAKDQARLDEARAMPKPDFSEFGTGMEVLREPAFKVYSLADGVLGAPIAVMSVVSGVGLIGLREGSRKLAIVSSALKVVTLVVLLVYAMLVVYPIQNRMAMKQLQAQAKFQASLNPRAGAVNPFSSPQVLALMSGSTMVTGFFVYALIGAYPAVAFFMLRKPAVRAAFLPAVTVDEAQGTDPS
jgi:hypothetical protein